MRLFAAVVAALLLAVTVVQAQSTVKPMQGTPVGLEGDPGSVVAPQTTNRLGNVAFAGLAPGRYFVFVPDASRLQAPVSIRIDVTPVNDAPSFRSQTYTIQPGRERGYALDARGQRLVVTVPRARGRISVNVSSIFGRGQEGPMSSY